MDKIKRKLRNQNQNMAKIDKKWLKIGSKSDGIFNQNQSKN